MRKRTPDDPMEYVSRIGAGDYAGCWHWSGPVHSTDGIPVYHRPRPGLRARRVVWELERGPVPPRLSVIAACPHALPTCVAPDHCELVPTGWQVHGTRR